MTGAPAGPAVIGLLAVVVPVVASVVLWPQRGLRGSGSSTSGGGARPIRGLGRSGRPTHRGRGGSQRGSRQVAAVEEGLAELVGVLASPLRAGVPPSVAVTATAAALAGGTPLDALVRDLSSAAARGAPLATVWHTHAAVRGSADLGFVARAWALSEQTGAPLAEALACAEQVLLARMRARERLASAAAGPKASMAVLCLLPASGPLVGILMGVDPMTLYFSSAVGAGSLALGGILGLGAWAWSRRILRGVL